MRNFIIISAIFIFSLGLMANKNAIYKQFFGPDEDVIIGMYVYRYDKIVCRPDGCMPIFKKYESDGITLVK